MSRPGHGNPGCRWSLNSIASLSLALMLVATLTPALAQALKPGDLDRSFGDDGKAQACGGHGGHFVPIAIDAHNRIVSGGDCLSRTLPSGRPDQAFAISGGAGRSLAFDRGRIVTAGYYGHHEGFALARYMPNGSGDSSFNGYGPDFGDPHASALSVAVDSHRRPVAAGYTQSANGDADFALARFKWNGALDPSFGAGGKVRTDFGTDGDYANSMAIDSRGRIVVGGGGPPSSRCGSCTGSVPGFELARYDPDGTLDPSFGSGGKVTTDFGARSRLNSIAIDGRGRIVAAGAAANHAFALARYKPNGRLDRSFSNNGKVRGPLRNNAGAGFVGIDSQRRIVAVGAGGVNDFRLARYLPNGSLNRSFGKNGKVKFDHWRPNVWSAAIDSRDRIVVGACNASVRLLRFIGYSGHR